jgi:hypothetical protein
VSTPSDSGNSAAATEADPRVRHHRSSNRPLEFWAAALLLTCAVVPVAIVGVALALQPGLGPDLWQKITGMTLSLNVGTQRGVFAVIGLLLVVISVAFESLVWLSVRPNRGARTLTTVLVALQVLVLAFDMGRLGADRVTIAMVVVAAVGTILLYLPRSERFLASQR